MYRESWLITKFKFFFFIFYLFGLTFNPYNPWKNRSKFYRVMANCLPLTFLIGYTFYLTVMVWIFIADTKRKSISILFSLLIIIHIVRVTLATLTTLIFPQRIEIFWNSISDLTECIEYLLELKIPYEHFKRWFCIKLCGMFFLFGFTTLSSCLIAAKSAHYPHKTFALMHFWHLSGSLLLLLYIEFVAIFHSMLNEKLNTFMMERHSTIFYIVSHRFKVIRMLRNAKNVHFMLRKVVKHFNDCYGWILLIHLLYFTNQMMRSIWEAYMGGFQQIRNYSNRLFYY